MTPPTDPALTKARLLWERAKREQEAAEEAAYQARRRQEVAWLAYLEDGYARGQCVACGKAATRCECVACASPAEPQPWLGKLHDAFDASDMRLWARFDGVSARADG